MFDDEEANSRPNEGEQLGEMYRSQIDHASDSEIHHSRYSHLSQLHPAHQHHHHELHQEHMSMFGEGEEHPSSKEGQFDAVFTILIIAILCSSLLFVGYYLPGIPIGSGNVQTLNRGGFLDSIRLNGGYASNGESLNMTLFSVPGTIHKIDGDQVIVFEYKSVSDANKDASRISVNGSYIDGKQYAWQASPHFYKNGRVLVLYLGSNQRTLALLSYVLGQPFTGAPISFTTACSTTNRCPGTETCVAFVGDTLCLKKDPCTLCGDKYSCKKIGSYPVEVVCSK